MMVSFSAPANFLARNVQVGEVGLSVSGRTIDVPELIADMLIAKGWKPEHQGFVCDLSAAFERATEDELRIWLMVHGIFDVTGPAFLPHAAPDDRLAALEICSQKLRDAAQQMLAARSIA